MICETELTGIAHGGACVGRAADGKTIFARFGLPSEKVAVEITRTRSTYLRGDVVEVLASPSPHRVAHPWPQAGPLGVGGADLGHVEFSYQSAWKTDVLRQMIRRIGGVSLAAHLDEVGIEPVVHPLASDEATSGWRSRTRIEMVADADLRPAMHREGTHDTVALDSMPLAVEEIDGLDVFSGAWSSWLRPGARIRAVAPSGSEPLLLIGKRPYWAPGLQANQYVREDVVVDGALYSYRVRASGFWQVHREGAETLTRCVLDAAAPKAGEKVLELYSGAGLFTQPLAIAVGEAGQVAAYEGSRHAVEDSRANLRDFPWARCSTATIDASLARRALESEPNLVVADPPRAGLGIELATTLAMSKAERILLVSCDPAAMARDVAAMVSAGRQVRSLTAIDIFPNTHHVEAVILLCRANC